MMKFDRRKTPSCKLLQKQDLKHLYITPQKKHFLMYYVSRDLFTCLSSDSQVHDSDDGVTWKRRAYNLVNKETPHAK